MFNNLRSFPEWHDMDDSIGETLQHAQKHFALFGLAHGHCFSEFARKQPDQQVQDPLFRADEKVKQAEQFSKDSMDVLVDVRTELNQLRGLKDDIRAKRKNCAQIQEKAEKTIKAAQRAEAKLEQLRTSKPGSPEMQKAQDEYEVHIQQKQVDTANREERERQLEIEEKEYQKQTFSVILKALGMYATERVKSCEGIIQLCDDICLIGKEIRGYEDSGIEILQTQLQELKNEPED